MPRRLSAESCGAMRRKCLARKSSGCIPGQYNFESYLPLFLSRARQKQGTVSRIDKDDSAPAKAIRNYPTGHSRIVSGMPSRASDVELYTGFRGMTTWQLCAA